MGSRFFIGDLAFGTALAFLAGVFAASLHWPLFFILATAAICSAGTLYFCRHLWRECLLFFLALAAGIFYFHYYTYRLTATVDLPFGKATMFQGVVTEEPQPSEKSLILTLGTGPPLRGMVKVFAPLGSNYSYGDEVAVTGTIEPPDPKKGGDPAVFSPTRIVRVAEHKGFFLRAWLIGLKLRILRVYNDALPTDEAALLGGIVFGTKVNFKKDLKAAMALSGLTHLVAISGYNITIVIFAAGSVFGRYFSRRVTFWLATIFLILFILMVGTEASAVRAAIMGFLALVARELGRRFSMRNAITLTAAGMTIADPTALTGSMSFVLSFASLLGIVYAGPPLKKLLRQEDADGGILGWKENAVTTLSAQVAVMPVLMRVFGQFSAMALLANVLVLGTVPLTMFLGFLLAAAGLASRYLAFFTGTIVGMLLAYQLAVIRLFAAWAVPLPVSFASDFMIALYYVTLATFIISYGRLCMDVQKI